MKKLIILLIISAVLAFVQIKKWVSDSGPLLSVVNVVIPRGASTRTVAEKLTEKGVIDKPLLFRTAVRFYGLDKELKAGEYQFMPQMSLLQVMKKMASGEVFFRKITLPEGLTTGQILYLIASTPELSGEINMEVGEGELLPETYSFELGASRDSIVMQAKNAMEKVRTEAWEMRDTALPYKDINQMLTMASIIEKETAVANERALVASVFINRLRKGMRLQTDPTVIYAVTEGECEFGRSLKKADLQIDSPYNTYKYYGLPPGPICNPGREAILAAVHPAESDYLYFVADGRGGHNFAKNLNEHNRNVRQWVRRRR